MKGNGPHDDPQGCNGVTPLPVTPQGGFWQEFLRVQCDKIILLALIMFLWRIGQFEMMKYVIGGLIVAINHNRFRWT